MSWMSDRAVLAFITGYKLTLWVSIYIVIILTH